MRFLSQHAPELEHQPVPLPQPGRRLRPHPGRHPGAARPTRRHSALPATAWPIRARTRPTTPPTGCSSLTPRPPMPFNRSADRPRSPTRLLEDGAAEKLQRRSETTGSLGELEPLAVRLGLIQNTLKPRLRDAAARDLRRRPRPGGRRRRRRARRSHRRAASRSLLDRAAAGRRCSRSIQGLELSVVDCGVAEPRAAACAAARAQDRARHAQRARRPGDVARAGARRDARRHGDRRRAAGQRGRLRRHRRRLARERGAGAVAPDAVPSLRDLLAAAPTASDEPSCAHLLARAARRADAAQGRDRPARGAGRVRRLRDGDDGRADAGRGEQAAAVSSTACRPAPR